MPAKIRTLWIVSCFAIFISFLFLSFQARVREVRTQAEQEKIQRLKEKAEQAKEKEKNDPARQIKRIAELSAKGKYDEAMTLARAVAEQDPRNAEAYVWWGIAQVKSGQREEALPQFVKASELNPRNPEVYVYWGLILAMMGKHEDAIQKYETALKLDPENSNAHAYWGTSLDQLGKHGESMTKLEKALTLDKANPTAYDALMDVFYNNQQYEKAWETVFRARNVNLTLSQESLDRLSRKMPEPKR